MKPSINDVLSEYNPIKNILNNSKFVLSIKSNCSFLEFTGTSHEGDLHLDICYDKLIDLREKAILSKK